jgi:hypothetical protein
MMIGFWKDHELSHDWREVFDGDMTSKTERNPTFYGPGYHKREGNITVLAVVPNQFPHGGGGGML